MKVALNVEFGGFNVNEVIYARMKRCGYTTTEEYYPYMFDDDRSNPFLIEAMEQLHEEKDPAVSGMCVTTVPDGVEWYIEEYDGQEWISEKHRTWGGWNGT